MKPRLFLFTSSLLALTTITSCNNQSDKSKTEALNTETKNDKTMDKEQLTDFGKKYSAA